ncbi:MAG TPA: thiamine-phosphate kinase [Acidimicrobiales bacterium]|nr:thiamine-phosphate kinase [Acidimicrobiales bacterium]
MGAPKSGATPRGRAGTARGTGGEFAAIERLARLLPGPPPGEVWLGDDAAVLAGPAGPGGQLVLSTDVAVAGVHGDLSLIGLDDLGWRALSAAVSDVAAMGARPRGAVLAVAGPPDTDLELLYRGVAAAAEAHGCPVVGGDLSTAGQLSVAVAVLGEIEGAPPAVLRSGARPGDRLFVTGPLGAAAAGLRALRTGAPARGPDDEALRRAHRRPWARLAEGEAARRAGARAMVDVSDGLLADLGHLADASGVGFRLDAVPVHRGASLDDALGGGDDYELVVAVADADTLLEAFARRGLRPPLALGSCHADPGLRTLEGEPVPAAGWEHPWGR